MELIGHRAIRRELRAFAGSETPPHALLFSGPRGLGRTALALEYAALLNCESEDRIPGSRGAAAPPCGKCRACRLIRERHHADLLLVGPGDAYCRPRAADSGHDRHPDSRDIRICQIRGIIEAVSRYPVEGRFRSVVIEPAERLGRDAAHALLKTLEEPPEHTIFVLVTGAPEVILETIRSRCRTMEVRPVARKELEEGLIARGVEPGLAGRAAAQARGRPVAAIAFAAAPEDMEVRDRLLDRCRRVAAEQHAGPRLAYAEDLADRWRRDRESVAPELAAWESFWESRLQSSAADREAARRALEALTILGRTRKDLTRQVLVRPLFDAMLLGFPTVTLDRELNQEATSDDA